MFVTVLIILKILHLLNCEEVIYYPSSSVINGNGIKSHISKRNVNNNDNPDDENLFLDTMRKTRTKRSEETALRGRPKTREEKWNEFFLNKSTKFDQTPSLIALLNKITTTYLNDCLPIILYDNDVASKESHLFENLFKTFPVTYMHGNIDNNNLLHNPDMIKTVKECVHYIVFLAEITRCSKAIGMQSSSKVVIIARTSQWAVQEYLANKLSRKFVNLLIIGQSFKEDDDDKIEAPYILYTHKLYTDGLGGSMPIVLNSWTHGKFSREIDLFPPKMTKGYAGHRFIVAASHQPPFVFRRIKSDLDGGNPRVVWDGIELRILHMLAERNNFSIEIQEPRDMTLGPGDAVAKEVTEARADIAIAGMYLTKERIREMDMSYSHSQDCAVFVTLLSTALPRYRAILGPFHWHVWVALTFTYLIGIFPLAFSDKHTLKHLLHDTGEIENMFWYVFGTFTNCFTFLGKNSWSKTNKITTRLLIGWYWIFTIIITSCYTGSIIAFVTLPIFPETVDTVEQLLDGFYRIGTLDRGGWEKWFSNSSDHKTNKLLKKMELVPNVEAGIRNTTKAFFWSYSFLGSKSELEYIVQANFTTTKSKKDHLHISNECFVPFGISIGFPNQSIYTAKLSSDIERIIQSGLMDKIVDEVKWEIHRSTTGKHLAVSPGNLKISSAEEKGLTLEDTQGMFLLLFMGFLIAAVALISEWMGGCTRRFKIKKDNHDEPLTNSTGHLVVTPASDVRTEIKIITTDDNDDDSKRNFDSRTTTANSQETLEGEIDVTESDIVVHDNFDLSHQGSRRSSSVDLDREVREIFERDAMRKKYKSVEHLDFVDGRETSTSRSVFGHRINSE